MKILITGAAGNRVSFLTRYLLPTRHPLNLLVHQTELPFQEADHTNVTVFKGDLGAAKPFFLPVGRSTESFIFGGTVHSIPGALLPR